MNYAQANRVAGGDLQLDLDTSCGFASSPSYDQIYFMVMEGRVVLTRVTDPRVRTLSGIGVGSTSAQINRAYGRRIRRQGGAYHYVPTDREDRNHRIVFNVEDGVVTSIEVGELPHVGEEASCF